MALLLAAIYSSDFFRSRMYFPGILDVLISKVRPDYGPTYSGVILNRKYLSLFALASVLWCLPAQAASRAIVRVQGGASALNLIWGQLNCDSAQSIGDPSGQLFVVSSSLDSVGLLGRLSLFPAILSSEPDQVATTTTAHTAPDALYDTTPATYYGQSVPHGYISQPATSIVRLADAQAAFGLTGLGTVAVIDTGVDPNHPVLANVLLPGYDFTRNQPGASEMSDVPPSTSSESGPPSQVNGNTVANVSQSTAAVVDGSPGYAAFGHGTMVAGIIHLVAPSAHILPLKAFRSDGTGYLSDILRALYVAGESHVQVTNMSFDFPSYSRELNTAIQFLNTLGVVCVAAAGNDGKEILVYPAALDGLVIGVASTTNTDRRSSFSNYGPNLVWIAAPGEGIVTTYPFGTFAAGWGTSFSAPLASGTAALLFQMSALSNQSAASQVVAHAVPLGLNLGNGRIDILQALQAGRQSQGIP